ncbi:hypothetical protein PORY_000945 [Pneumocystis oryctolagi]|uniref:Uncharacterized protein n=1 Tax=Pneumocystis oryctolagi TaxID=42067 RepID=A0ACB7CIC1_9ASCO|nr:hypothetical protein PORY_000945 [Pneumocystis oryctolagi]
MSSKCFFFGGDNKIKHLEYFGVINRCIIPVSPIIAFPRNNVNLHVRMRNTELICLFFTNNNTSNLGQKIEDLITYSDLCQTKSKFFDSCSTKLLDYSSIGKTMHVNIVLVQPNVCKTACVFRYSKQLWGVSVSWLHLFLWDLGHLCP